MNAMPPTPYEQPAGSLTEILKILGHDLRLTLMQAMLHTGEKSVGELEALTHIGQPGLSQQLAILRKAGLVHTRRESKQIFYRIAPEPLRPVAELLEQLSGLHKPINDPTLPSGPPPIGASSAATFARIV